MASAWSDAFGFEVKALWINQCASDIFRTNGNTNECLLHNGYTEGWWPRIGQRTARPQGDSGQFPLTGTCRKQPSPSALRRERFTISAASPRNSIKYNYPASGDPELARQVRKTLAPLPGQRDITWGLDHGTWSVLRHVYSGCRRPPSWQLSIDESQPARFHFDLGKKLAPLREQGILIIGSGNLVHNLHTYAWGQHAAEPYDWRLGSKQKQGNYCSPADFNGPIDYEQLGR
jgi:4,5-DOPA dioxygenase extradiol